MNIQIFGLQRFLTVTLVSMLMSGQCAHEIEGQVCATDTIGLEKELEELVVTPREVTRFEGATIYRPSKELKKVTDNCTQLLAGLAIPGVIVNPATGNITVSGKNHLLIKINGKQVSDTDLMSIASKDIVKIEYISAPGVRYGDADAVLEITVRRREEGYGVMLNLLQSANKGWCNYSGAFKYNIGKSEWSVDYHSNPMWDMDCYRDNSEKIVMADGCVINRYESGTKTPNRMVTHHASLQYSYAEGSKMLLNIQSRLIRRNDRYASRGYITTETEGMTIYGQETEVAPIKSWQGDLDLYFHYNINRQHKIYLNVIPSIISGSTGRYYESPETFIASEIDNSSRNLLAEGVWEGKIGEGNLSAGINGKIGNSKAVYTLSGYVVREKESVGNLFCEWKQTYKKIQYSVGLKGTFNTIHKPVNSRGAYINPRLWFSYRPIDGGGVSVLFNAQTMSPTINQLNPVVQRIDNYQWSEGNSYLKPYQRFESMIEFDGNYKTLNAKLTFTNRYSRNPVMSVKEYAGSDIVTTYVNAGHNNDFEFSGTLRMPLISHHLTLSLEAGWHQVVSRGRNYRHKYSQPFVNAQMMLMIGEWWVMLKYNNAYNQLWGEMVSTVNQNLFNIGVGYKYRNATFMAGIVNPFGNVALHTKDLSEKAGYDRTYVVSGSRQLIWGGVSMNLYKGKKRVSAQKKLDNQIIYESIKNQMK